MRKKQRRQETIGQIPFADLAMAALAPIAILMLVFMLIASKGISLCKPLNEEQINAKIEKLNEFIEALDTDIQFDIKQQINLIECKKEGVHTTPKAELNPQSTQLFSYFLELGFGSDNLCAKDIHAILEKSKLGRNQDLHQLLNLFDDALGSSLHEINYDCLDSNEVHQPRTKKVEFNTCKVKPLDPETGRKLNDSYFDSAIAEIVIDLNKKDIFAKLAELGFTDDTMCAKDANTILTESKFKSIYNPQEFLGLFDNSLQQAVHSINEKCMGREIQQPPEKKVEFKSCKTIPLSPDTKEELTDEYFDTEIDKIVAELSKVEFSDYNRIDIFGHTDQRPIRGTCPNGAKNNRELSSLRVHVYLDKLLAALERNQDQDESHQAIYARWQASNLKNKLKFYAIGVGASEPKANPCQDEQQQPIPNCDMDAQNRRIEIRYVREKRS